MKKEKCRFEVSAYTDRQKVVEGLTNSGYIVSIEIVEGPMTLETHYFVVVHNE